MRKEQAQKKALKVVGDAWDAERKIDMDLAELLSPDITFMPAIYVLSIYIGQFFPLPYTNEKRKH